MTTKQLIDELGAFNDFTQPVLYWIDYHFNSRTDKPKSQMNRTQKQLRAMYNKNTKLVRALVARKSKIRGMQRCSECGNYYSWFYVQNADWLHGFHSGYICLECSEKRIERPAKLEVVYDCIGVMEYGEVLTEINQDCDAIGWDEVTWGTPGGFWMLIGDLAYFGNYEIKKDIVLGHKTKYMQRRADKGATK